MVEEATVELISVVVQMMIKCDAVIITLAFFGIAREEPVTQSSRYVVRVVISSRARKTNESNRGRCVGYMQAQISNGPLLIAFCSGPFCLESFDLLTNVRRWLCLERVFDVCC